MKKLAFFLILLFVIKTDFLWAQTATNVKGTWIMNVETNLGSGSPTFVLDHVDATTLKGTYTGQLGDSEVKVTLKGNTSHLEFSISGEII